MNFDPDQFLPAGLPSLANPQTALPAIAKDERLMALIDDAVRQLPTGHEVVVGDAREMGLEAKSVHLVLTSPPYWTKEYRHSPGQLGDMEDYAMFLGELDRVWQQCYSALVPGGRPRDMFSKAEVALHARC
ncbi:MAG TPA: hypothetical protein VHX65_17845 [Pirellulales bacterium]|jgi:hypothetical protein|nr:hypothetical protein [Pirellulales bacterium]